MPNQLAETPVADVLPVDIALATTLACVWEATAPKPGNVHRGADFEDVTYLDFIHSGVVIGPILAEASRRGVGQTVLEAVRRTRAAVATNTNLGTILLLAPLAAVPPTKAIADGIGEVLKRLTCSDTRAVYEAIRTSAAGGLGHAPKADVFADPPADLNLVEAMRMAADRDLVARQYAVNFADVFGLAQAIEDGVAGGWPLMTAIVHAHMQQLAKEPDSLILRKCGPAVAQQATAQAARIVDTLAPEDKDYGAALADFDFWLRSDGHRRNPGTTADLIAAGLFVLLREGRLDWKSLQQPAAAKPAESADRSSAPGLPGIIQEAS
ncbi:MAG: triphosphoribosyl-dephospho-CoA synthase [Pirellulales bacterium]